MNKTHLITLSLIVLALASCSGTRNLAKPDLNLPEVFHPGMSADSLSIADMKWWEFYGDSTLRHIIGETLEHNRDILIAAARVEELGALYGVDKLNYLPTITGLVGETRETNDYYGEKFIPDPEISVKFTLNWEADLWGGLSQAQKRSKSQYRASVYDLRAMQMTLAAHAATAYYNLVALENEISIVRRTLSTRREALAKAKLRFEGGMTSEIVYQQAIVEYNTAAAMLPGLERNITLARNAINLLMGRYPSEWLDNRHGSLSENVPEHLPVGLPSDLLERRPDLKASEARLAAAMAACGVAYSNQFPKIRIGITGGWENDEVPHLFQSPFSYLLGNIVGTVFDFGRNHRRYKASIAAYEQARLAYEKAVMAAFTEVDNARITYRATRQSAHSKLELREAALKYVKLADAQYNAGAIGYIDVLDAHRRYFEAEISFSNALRDEYLAIVNLYKALGGGWQTKQE